MKTKWYLILLVGLVIILAIFPLSCGNKHLDNAEDYLKSASRAASDLRIKLESYRYNPDYPEVWITNDYDEILQTIYDIQWSIDKALWEIHEMRQHYDPPERN